ncbi:MaoC family dehydratase [Allosphingosinicella flava]|uniref:MaoC family dehydratase n=1 Tax=Allosphingosinicella flava TaxID=2771430 RepID=A0A7T2GIN5_9SPHN|nr:MaoC family dehydratase [Sphingosinicella flava]QPQ54243.1 MaoC family dehydratase [Sphingosinicella flava]
MTDKCLSRLEAIGPQRYRESHGLHYEDFTIGDVYEHRPGRTVTEVDNIWQSLINMNQHPLHIDHAYAAETEFGQPLVSSLVTFSIVGGLSLASTSARAIANLGWRNVRLVAPVFVGDTLYAESKVLEKRESGSRPGQGIVTMETRGLKADGTEVLVWERSFLVPLRGAEARAAA